VKMHELHKPTERVVKILEKLSSVTGGLGLAELSHELNIPKGTLFPILRTLVEFKYLEFSNSSKTYQLGVRLFTTGAKSLTESSQYKSINKALQRITKVCNETSQFGVLEEGNVLYIAKEDSDQSLRIRSSIGIQLPAYATAIGKALLSDMSMDELTHLYASGLKPLTHKTSTSIEVLYKQICLVNETGFAYEVEESNESIRCIAKPLRVNGKIVAAISVAIPLFRYTEDLQKIIEQQLTIVGLELEQIIPFIIG